MDAKYLAEIRARLDADRIPMKSDMEALLTEVERLAAESAELKSNHAHWHIEELEVQGQLRAENTTLKKALELMATYLVHFGRIDEMLCDDIPQPLHLKYQPKNDGDYENGPCIQCVQEYFQQQAQQTHETQEEEK